MKRETLLEVGTLNAGYDQMEILRDVSIHVGEGEVVTLIGPNGAGKSTLLKAIFGLLRISSGTIRFRGEDIAGRPPKQLVKRGISYVPQVDNVFPSLTVEENLQMGAVTVAGDARPRMEHVLCIFPVLSGRLRQRVGTMSGGERQMVAIGRALMLEPTFLLLDEPSAALSPAMVETVFDRIREISGRGVSVLLVEQNAREALRLSHRGYVLAGGQQRLEGAGEALLGDVEVKRLYLGG
jgi:ABC-type branched-subunit amino acid transport system ATPase component